MVQLDGIDATVEVWKHLHGLKLDLLDAVHIGAAVDGACVAVACVVSLITFLIPGTSSIDNWLFTATDGTVKSKKNTR